MPDPKIAPVYDPYTDHKHKLLYIPVASEGNAQGFNEAF